MVALLLALLEHPAHVAEVEKCLKARGYEVVVVNCFSAAMESLNTRRFDLIISDVHLENGGSIFDFLKWTKSQKRFQGIPFALFSLEPTAIAKYLAEGVEATARVFGAAKYITMDVFDPVILSDAITELLPVRINVPLIKTNVGE